MNWESHGDIILALMHVNKVMGKLNHGRGEPLPFQEFYSDFIRKENI